MADDRWGCRAGDVSGENVSLAVERAWGRFEYGCEGVMAGEIRGVKKTLMTINESGGQTAGC